MPIQPTKLPYSEFRKDTDEIHKVLSVMISDLKEKYGESFKIIPPYDERSPTTDRFIEFWASGDYFDLSS